jgi:hypothetical protein
MFIRRVFHSLLVLRSVLRKEEEMFKAQSMLVSLLLTCECICDFNLWQSFGKCAKISNTLDELKTYPRLTSGDIYGHDGKLHIKTSLSLSLSLAVNNYLVLFRVKVSNSAEWKRHTTVRIIPNQYVQNAELILVKAGDV